MPDSFEYAILGGGAAGLSLALALTRSPLGGGAIVIVEREAKTANDRTWCFWSDQPTPFDALARRTWPRLRFRSPGFERSWDLAPFRYLMLRGLDFYDHARAELGKHDVTFVRGSAQVQDGERAVTVSVAGEGGRQTALRAAFAFDSRLGRDDLRPRPRRNYLKQHFLGWEIETAHPVFDPQTVTMFDLCTPQRGGITFFYTLPLSPTSALVEYTLFSPAELPPGAYETALQGFLEGLGAGEHRLLGQERGVIPMTDHPFPRRQGRRILAIGTRGGRVKPSTGYAFARIQRDSEHIVASLRRHGHPFALPADPLRYRLHDAVMLEILAAEPDMGRPIFAAIFGKNPVQRVLRFLDGRSSPQEDLAVMTAHPPGPFLRAIARRFF